LTDRNQSVCPVEYAGGLDTRIRRWLQNPKKILGPLVEEGMTVLDVGCGPGFFSIDMAVMVGETGKVVAADLQEGMLQIIRGKIAGTPLEQRIVLHKCEENKLGVTEEIDFALAFYMVHEIPDQLTFYSEIASVLKPGGELLVVEPPVHVSKSAFKDSVSKAQKAGLTHVESPKSFLNKTALLQKQS